MLDFECFITIWYDINEIIFIFFYTEKDIHFLKVFYNSLTAKNRFVNKCAW